MVIEQLFQEDINRKINGVVKVDQDATDVLVQELDEYVITRDLKKHFITFFNNYGESFHEETADIGVWISASLEVVNLTFLRCSHIYLTIRKCREFLQ